MVELVTNFNQWLIFVENYNLIEFWLNYVYQALRKKYLENTLNCLYPIRTYIHVFKKKGKKYNIMDVSSTRRNAKKLLLFKNTIIVSCKYIGLWVRYLIIRFKNNISTLPKALISG